MSFTQNFKFALLLTLLFFTGGRGFAQSIDSSQLGGQQFNAITTAVPFLLICPESAGGGRGESGVAMADNANATHWNLSGLAFTDKKSGISLSYTPWLRQLVPDIHLSYLSGFYRLNESGSRVIAGSIRFFSLGEIEFTDNTGNTYGTFNANEFAIDGGYTQKVTKNFSTGVMLRFIYSNLASGASVGGFETKAGTSIAGDINMTYRKDFAVKGAGGETPLTVGWGINISNIGSKISYTNSSNKDFIPTNFRAGVMLKGSLDEYNSLTWTADVNKLLVPSAGGQSDLPLMDGIFGSFTDADGGFKEEMSEFNIATGIEYWYNELFAARVGFFNEDKDKGNRKFITLGAGVRYNVFGLDFAYLASLTQNHPLQNTLRFSLTLDFDAAGNR
jgi:Type IX secretion system protein PorV